MQNAERYEILLIDKLYIYLKFQGKLYKVRRSEFNKFKKGKIEV